MACITLRSGVLSPCFGSLVLTLIRSDHMKEREPPGRPKTPLAWALDGE